MGTPLDAKQIFLVAVDLLPAEREDFVAGVCGADEALRARVDALLIAADGAGPFLSSPTAGGEDADASGECTGARVGHFTLCHRIAEGGFGTVWMAEQQEPLRRHVALKLLRAGMDTEAIVARFEQERQALALMEHPNIAKVFEGGATPAGRPYFAMELVRGAPIHEFCDDERLEVRARLVLFTQVCRAVHHAHQKGVIHRDLKPGNVLVASTDGVHTPKVIDFGIAKALHGALGDAALVTEADQWIGTPEYMAPEQMEGGGADVDTRADIYSLGVLLYELLTGAQVFDVHALGLRGRLAMLQAMQEREPLKPSARVGASSSRAAEIARRRRTDPRRLVRSLHGDLDWIVMKALEKDRARRYVSADALAADVEAHLRNEAVLAGPPSRVYRLRKYVLRHRAAVTAAVLALAALLAGLSLALLQAERADRNARRLAAKMREFDQLATVVLHDRTLAAERELYPAWPVNIAAMEQWLQQACDPLLAMQPDIEAAIAALTAPVTGPVDDRQPPQLPTPISEELAERLTVLRRAQAIREGRASLDLPPLPAGIQALGVVALNQLAWERVAPRPEERIYGEEAFGLACAEAALAKCRGGEVPESQYLVLDTLAWALFANGKDTAALARSAEALAAAPATLQQNYRARRDELSNAMASSAATLAAAERRHAAEHLTAVEQFLQRELVELRDKLDHLRDHERVAVERRLAWARRIGELSAHHPGARISWDEVRAAIAAADGVRANELYRGRAIELRDEDVVGLVPIGMNPKTRLWEFYELRSAWDGKSDPATIPIPRHDPEDGSIEVTSATGIVFVLLAGGTFTMGAQSRDRRAPMFDPEAHDVEMPNEVTLAPFFFARHELTRAQHLRLGARTPRFYHEEGRNVYHDPVPIGPTHPAECMDWNVAERLMAQHGMQLPTEAQWEYGCRAGTTTPWWTGDEPASLAGAANVLDETGGTREPLFGTPERFEDGFVLLAPVGRFRDNAFGLFDVHGNVWEWCADRPTSYAMPARIGDGVRAKARAAPDSPADRVLRGGGYQAGAGAARCSQRVTAPATVSYGYLGLRPARSLRQPSPSRS